MPLVFVAVAVKLQAVLDFTNTDLQRAVGVSLRRMVTTDWQAFQDEDKEAVTQALGRIAWRQKLEAILVPSARAKGVANFVLFPGRRRRGSSWKIAGARKLPRKTD